MADFGVLQGNELSGDLSEPHSNEEASRKMTLIFSASADQEWIALGGRREKRNGRKERVRHRFPQSALAVVIRKKNKTKTINVDAFPQINSDN